MSSITVQVYRNQNLVNVGINSTGPQGQSAYEAWLALGNVGTRQEFIDSQFDEPTRVTNENTRKTNELTRIANENTRIENENLRQQQEGLRQQEFETNETTRQTNETTRIANEEARQEADILRGQTVEAIEANYAPRLTSAETQINDLDAQLEDIALVNPRDYGAKFDGSTDDTTAIQNAINAAPNGATILIGGRCILKSGLVIIGKSLKFKGATYINSNFTGTTRASRMYFSSSNVIPICIDITDGTLCLENLVIAGEMQAICINSLRSNVTLNNTVIQMFTKAIKITEAYYCKFNNSYIGFCDFDAEFNHCYNVNFVNMTLMANIQCIILNNNSNLNIHGGSLEKFSTYGIAVNELSNVVLFGTYFEGTTLVDNNACVFLGSDYASVTAIGCHVYLSKTHHFVLTDKNYINIFSKNNRLILPVAPDLTEVVVYKFNTNEKAIKCTVDIAGDFYRTTNYGVNVLYCHENVSSQTGIYNIIYPVTDKNYHKNIVTKDMSQFPAKNILLNASFKDTSNWGGGGTGTTFSVANGECMFLSASDGGNVRQTGLKMLNGHKYYASVWVKTTSNEIELYLYGAGNPSIKLHSGSGLYENLALIHTATTDSSAVQFQIRDERASGWDNVICKKAILVDLTETFGAGFEPTLIELTNILSKFTDNWFNDTISPILSIKEIYQLLP